MRYVEAFSEKKLREGNLSFLAYLSTGVLRGIIFFLQ